MIESLILSIGRMIDHWLCRFAVTVNAFPREPAPMVVEDEDDNAPAILASRHSSIAVPQAIPGEDIAEDPFHFIDRSKPLRVHDALIEVRIGSKWPGTDRYRIIGYSQRWRPIKTKGRISTELMPPIHENAEHDREGEEAEPVLVYVLDADSQRYLAPYYLTPSGHHFGFQSASGYSLVLNTIQRDGMSSTDLFLQIEGGSPQSEFVVHWSYWRPDTITTDGVKYVGSGAILPGGLVPAVYNVIADVIDKGTGQRKRHQKMIFARSSSPAEPGDEGLSA